MLTAEGYIISRQGAPTRVAPGLRLEKTFSEIREPYDPVQPVPTRL